MASNFVDDRICDSGSEYGDAEDFSLSQYTPGDKKRKGSPLTDNPIKKQNSLPDISKVKKCSNFCSGYSLEPSHRDDTSDYPQHIFWLTIYFPHSFQNVCKIYVDFNTW